MSDAITVSAVLPPGADELVERAVRHCAATEGVRADNLQRGIACYESALEFYTQAAYPAQWAVIQNNLGAAYEELHTGNRADHVRKAIPCYESALRVHTESDHPTEWAAAQNNLGTAWAELRSGDRGEHLRTAIA